MEDYKEFKKNFPKEKRHLITPEVYETIKRMNDDPEFDLREEMITYSKVLAEGKYTVINYANACKYLAYKAMGFSNFDAYKRVFPDKVKKWLEEGVPYDHQHAYVGKYNKSPLVVKLTERSLIPHKILNQDKAQKGINVLEELALNAKSEMVRMKAAEALVRELKIDNDNKLELDITVKKDESLVQLEQSIAKLAEEQVKAIKENRADPKAIAEMQIIEAEVEDNG